MNLKPITYEINKKGNICIGGVDLTKLAQESQTPLYVIDEATLRSNCQKYTYSLKNEYPNSLVLYASKALSTIGVLNVLAEENLGVDVVSGGELYTALQSKIDPKKIYFHGNNKSDEELAMAVENQIKIVIDNQTELTRVIELTKELKKEIGCLIRVRPGIEAHTHDFIKTGHEDSKFGVAISDLLPLITQIKDQKYVKFLGLHAHIGSQILDIEPYLALVSILAELTKRIKDELNITSEVINIGGGLGIQYLKTDDPPDISLTVAKVANHLKKELKKFGLPELQLIMEPGRSIIGRAGITIYKIGTIKKVSAKRTYLFIDGGMADNPRPLIYQSEYSFDIINKAELEKNAYFTIAGKFCESGDILAKHVALPCDVEVGDYLIVYSTGAYNYAMSSNYNRFCKPAMVLVNNGEAKLIVKRESLQDLIRNDLI